MKKIECVAVLVLSSTATLSTFAAEARCPGNVASLAFHLVNRHHIIIPVSVNHTGPYDFLLDTGTEITMVDSSLAAELHLASTGSARISGAGFRAPAMLAQLDLLEAGSRGVAGQSVIVYDLHRLKTSDLPVRGVLGEDFLERFDTLIDNAHSMLCLDDTGTMQTEVKGQRIPLLGPAPNPNGSGSPNSLIISVRLSDGMRPVRLILDSGANVPLLYNTSEYLAVGAFRGNPVRGGGANGVQRIFMTLPLQSVKIGSIELTNVLFFALPGGQTDHRRSDFDGLLTIGLFRWVLLCPRDQFVVFGR